MSSPSPRARWVGALASLPPPAPQASRQSRALAGRPWLRGLAGLRALAAALSWVTGFWPQQQIRQLGWLAAWEGRHECQKQGDLFLLQPQANG